MDANELYINSYLNSISNTLEFYVGKLLNTQIDSPSYSFCVERIVKMVSDVKALTNKLNVSIAHVNSFFNLLMLLKNYNIPEVNELLDSENYNQTFELNYNNALSVIKADNTPNCDDIFILNFMLGNHLIPDADKETVYNCIIKSVLKRNNYISLSSFKVLIMDYIKDLLKNQGINCNIVFKRHLSSVDQIYHDNCLYVDESNIESMFSRGNYQVLLDIYRGINMAKFTNDMSKKECDGLTATMIKDKIIAESYDDYERQNKSVMPYYVQSEINAYDNLINYFDNLNIQFYKGVNPYTKKQELLRAQINDNTRHFNDSVQSIDELFAHTVDYLPELTEKYPSLFSNYDFIKNLLGKD